MGGTGWGACPQGVEGLRNPRASSVSSRPQPQWEGRLCPAWGGRAPVRPRPPPAWGLLLVFKVPRGYFLITKAIHAHDKDL